MVLMITDEEGVGSPETTATRHGALRRQKGERPPRPQPAQPFRAVLDIARTYPSVRGSTSSYRAGRELGVSEPWLPAASFGLPCAHAALADESTPARASSATRLIKPATASGPAISD